MTPLNIIPNVWTKIRKVLHKPLHSRIAENIFQRFMRTAVDSVVVISAITVSLGELSFVVVKKGEVFEGWGDIISCRLGTWKNFTFSIQVAISPDDTNGIDIRQQNVLQLLSRLKNV